MKISADDWLSEHLGCPAFQVQAADEAGSCTQVKAHAAGKARAFYFAKVGTEMVEVARQLGRAGFFVADVNVTFARKAPAADVALPPSVEVRACTADDAEPVLAIAASAFRYTRFHLDALISNDVANRVKREWILNYVKKKRGDQLFVARIEDRPVGFLAALKTKSGEAVIDLIAVDVAAQRRGVGEALVHAFANHYRSSCPELHVGTQVANVPSCRLYEKCGFAFHKGTYVLHLHVRDGQPEM